MKNLVVLGLKVFFLVLLLLVCYSVAGMVVGLNGTPSERAMVALLLMCLLQSIVLSYIVIRSRWTGWRLVLVIMVVFYGIATFLSQIETVVFLRYLVSVVPPAAIPRLFVQGAIVALFFSPLVVLLHGKMRRETAIQDFGRRLVMPWTEWLWKATLIAVFYVAIYVAFGSFVFRPLAGKAFEEYYADLRLPVWILPFQMGRGVLWLVIALPVIQMMKGRWWETSLGVALLFSVLMGSLLLSPNPYMPDGVRMAHFVEVLSSNFLFGWVMVWLLRYRRNDFW